MISAEALQARLGSPELKVVDGSWFLDGTDARAAFRQAHLPGAVFYDLDASSAQDADLPHMLPSPGAFARRAGELGLTVDDNIVVYDQQGLFSAARVWWALRVMGARSVRVLDGGLPSWRERGGPLEAGDPAPPPAVFQARFDPAQVAAAEDVLSALTTGSAQVADARPAARFRGGAPEPRAGLRSGAMPGAANVPFGDLLNADRTLKSAEALRQAFAVAGVDPDRPVVATCGSGVTAAVVLLALARLGRDDGRLYDGSWADWGRRAELPVVAGASSS